MQIRDQKHSPKVNEEALLLGSALSRLSSLTVSPTNRDKLISQLLKDIKILFKASFCWMSITINDAFILKSYGSASVRNKLSRSELLAKLTPAILNRVYPLLHNRGSGPINQGKVLSQFLREQNFHNLMGVPLKRGTKVFGTLNVVRKNESAGYHRTDQKLLSSFGHLLEISLDYHTEEGVQPSERKKLEESSKSEQLKVNQVTKNIGVGLAIISRDFRTLWANDVLTRSFGKVEGEKCYFVYNRRSKVCPGCGVRKILKTGKSEIKHEQEGRDKYGNTIWSQIIATPIKDEVGKISAVMEVVVPITKHKLLENELVQKERIARERAQLLNDLRFLNQKDEVLNHACRAIRDSGLYERAVMTLHDESRQITHLGQVGLPRQMIQLARKAPPLDPKQIKRIMNKRFRISDSFFIPAEAGLDLSQSGRYIPQKKSPPHANWQIGDELFVPLRDFSGIVMGYLSVDTPTDGCRPDIKRIQSVEMLAEAAASRIRELDAQKVIEESEKKYRLLVENVKEGIYTTHQGSFINVNESMCRLFGYRRDELIGMPAWNLAVPEKRDMIKNLFFRKATTLDFSPVELECRRKDGTVLIAELKLSAVLGKQQFLGTVSDITERKRTEEDLFQSQIKYKALIEQIPVHTYTAAIDDASTSIYISPQIERIIGFTPKDFQKNPDLWQKRLHPEDRKRVLKELKHSHITGEPFISEYRMIHRKGNLVWVRDEAVLVWDTTGKPIFLQGVITNINDRKIAEEERLKIEEKYRLVVKNANEAIIIAQEGYLKFVNPKMIEILGYSEKELLSEPFSKLIHSDDRKMVLDRHLKRIKGEDVPSIYDFRVVNKKGRIKWLEINAVAITWEGKPATLNFLSDITKRKQDELLKEQYQEQKVLFELTQTLTSATNLDQMLKIATEKITEFLRIERGSIILVNPDGKSATFKALHVRKGYGGSDLLGFTFESISFTKLRNLILKKPFIINNTSLLPKGSFVRDFLLGIGVKSNLSVSLSYRNNLLGSLTIATKIRYHKFTTEEVRLLQIIANTISAIIVNYQLLEDSKLQAEKLDSQFKEQKMLFGLTQALSSATDLDHLLKIATEKATEILGTERCSIALANSDRKYVTVKAIHIRGKLAARNTPGSQIAIKLNPKAAHALIHGKPFSVNDTFSLPARNPLRKRFSKLGIKSTVLVPLVSRDNTLGFITVSSITKVHHYTSAETRLLQTIASPIATTIENRMLVEDLKNQAGNLEKQTREKDILLKVSQSLSQTMDLSEITKVASQVIGTALGVDRCSIILLTSDGNHVEVKGMYSKLAWREQKLVGKQYSVNIDKYWKTVIKKRKVLVINDIAKSSQRGIIQEHHLKEGLKSLLVTGMFFGKKLLGVLALSSLEEVRTFVPDEIKLVQAIANQVAVAIENARLVQVVKIHTQELKELSSQLMKAQENERKKIAQELHDQVGQMLQSMKMNLDRIKRFLSADPQRIGETKDWLVDIESLLSQTIDDIRTLTFDLRPSMLDDFGLFSTLRWYLDDYTRRSNLKVFLKGKEEKYRFPLEVEVNLYRIIQEALTNVAKHAQATEVVVFLSRKHSTAILSVKDNGKGFDAHKLLSSPHKGTGIFNMNERVNLLGGSFEIVSEPGKGTRVNVKIPFTEVKYEEGQIIDR